MTAAFQKSLAQSSPPPPIAWTNVVHATAAAKPVENSLIENVTSRLTDTSANKLIYTCLGAASALLIGTALIGASMQDSANTRPFVSKTKAEHILAAAGVVPHVQDMLPELIPAPVATTSTPTTPVNTLTSIMASTNPTPTPAPIETAATIAVPEPIREVASTPVATVTPPVMQTMTQRLDAMLAQGKYEDAIVFAYGEAPKLAGRDNDLRRGELLTWLHAHENSGKMPVLFTIAKLHASGENIESAAKWYMAASITGLLDASRCQDPEAAKAVRQLEEQFQDVRGYLKADGALRRSAVKFALDVEERLKNREPATWIASHTTSSTGSAFVNDVEWQAKREQYRKALQGYVDSK